MEQHGEQVYSRLAPFPSQFIVVSGDVKYLRREPQLTGIRGWTRTAECWARIQPSVSTVVCVWNLLLGLCRIYGHVVDVQGRHKVGWRGVNGEGLGMQEGSAWGGQVGWLAVAATHVDCTFNMSKQGRR